MVEELEGIFLNSIVLFQWMILILKYIRSVYWIDEYITFIFITEENVCFSPMPICQGHCTGDTLNRIMLFWGVPQGNYLRQKVAYFWSICYDSLHCSSDWKNL